MKKGYFTFIPGGICIYKEEIYFVDVDYNIFGKSNLEGNEVQILGSIPNEKFNTAMLAGKLLRWRDKIVIVPLAAKLLWLYDVAQNSWHSIFLNNENVSYRFSNAWLVEDKLLLVGYNDDQRVICVDLIKETFENLACEENCAWGRSIAFDGNSIYIVSREKPIVLKYDIKNMEKKCLTIEGGDNAYEGISWDGNRFWLVPNEAGYLTSWMPGQQCQKTELYLQEVSGIVSCNDVTFVASYTKKVAALIDHLEIKMLQNKDGYYKVDQLDSNNIYTITQNGNISLYNVKNKELKHIVIKMDNINFGEMAEKYADFSKKDLYSDLVIEKRVGLEDLIEYVVG